MRLGGYNRTCLTYAYAFLTVLSTTVDRVRLNYFKHLVGGLSLIRGNVTNQIRTLLFFVRLCSHGFNKKFARTTQQLRQAVGGSEVTVDILFEALLEKFNMQQRLVREFAKYIQSWLVSIKRKYAHRVKLYKS